MARKITRGLLLLLVGSILGVVTGIGFRVLERYLAHEIVDLLRDEARASCPCELEYDSIRLSLLTMKAECRGVRMLSEGKLVLSFNKITVDASLWNIFSREILLNRLRLSGGIAHGVSEESPTFRFIDYLSQPLPPELQDPNRLKAKLIRLEVEDSRFIEDLGSFRLLGKKVSMVMERNSQDAFVLHPQIGRLSLVSNRDDIGEAFKNINLGKISGDMTIGDVSIAYRSFQIALKRSLLSLSGDSQTDQGNALSGKAHGMLSLEDIPGLPLTVGTVSIDGALEGSLGRPMIPANVTLPSAHTVVIGPHEQPYLVFNQLSGNLSINGTERPPSLQIEKMTISGDAALARITKPVYLGDSTFRGSLFLEADAIPFPSGVVAKRVKATIDLSGNAAEPLYQIAGSGTLSLAEGIELPDFQFRIGVRDADLDFDAWRTRTHAFGEERLTIKGPVDNFSDDIRHSKGITLEINNLLLTDSNSESSAVLVGGVLDFDGALNQQDVNGKGQIVFTSLIKDRRQSLEMNALIKNGSITLAGELPDKSLSARLALSLGESGAGILDIKTDNFSIDKLHPNVSCLTNSASLRYLFTPADFLKGNGELALSRLALGCEPYGLLMPQSTVLPITAGTLSLSPLKLVNNLSTIQFSGGISTEQGYQLAASSRLNLESLLGLFRSIDDLKGDVSADLAVKGPFARPKISGNLKLNDALFSLEAVDIAGSHISGALAVENNSISFEKFSGDLNGGRFSINGSLAPFQKHESKFLFELKDILFETREGLSAVWSGVFRLGDPGSGLPSLKGDVEIKSAEIRRQIDLLTIIKAIRESISARAANSQAFAKIPFDALDVTINIPGNFLLLSNWASAELAGTVHIGGDPVNPIIEGQIETISGWYGFKNRQFQITSGRLIFSPLSPTPEIDLLSETLVRSHLGDNVFMVLEAKGSIDNPRIHLSSDSGLSERDLLSILTTGQSPTQQNLLSTRGYGFSLEDRPLIDPTRPFSLLDFLRDLTRIDVLSVEPTFNARTGAVEPTFIAQRKLTEDLTAFAQNSFGGGSSDSEAGLSLALAQPLALIGSVESSSARQNNALAVDLSYTILAAQRPFVEISFEGVSQLSDSEMLRALRLAPISRVRPNGVERLAQKLANLHRDRGFFSAKVDARCVADREYCRKIIFAVKEMKRSRVSQIVFTGDEPPRFISEDELRKSLSDSVATKELVTELEQELVNKLRSEGFIAARVAARYREHESSRHVSLEIDLTSGRPVTFIFIGNTIFSPEDFLETIDLFGRKQPFGSNTINILIDNIEQKYREAGHLYAAISYKKEIDPVSQRVIYTVDIREEDVAPVREVIFEGLASFSKKEMQNIIRRELPTLEKQIFSPSFAIEEELENNCQILKNLYQAQGFPGSKVRYELKPDFESSGVRIVYTIEEGRSERREWLVFDDTDSPIIFNPLPEHPYTIPEANRIISERLNEVYGAGYLSAYLKSSRATNAQAPIRMIIEKGPRTSISAIDFEGLVGVAENTIRRELLVAPGDPWSAKKIDESRRKLFKLGLFSEIQTFPEDRVLDSESEVLVFRFAERPLTTVGVGTGANSAFGLHLFGEAIDRSLLADGRMLSMRFDTYYQPSTAEVTQGTANLRYLDPAFLSEEYVFTEDLRYQNLQRATQEFDLNRVSLSSSVQRTFSEWPTIALAHTILTEELTNVPVDSAIGVFDTGRVRLGFLSGTATFDRRDSPFNPADGYVLNADFRVASKAFGSEAEFVSAGTGASTIVPLPSLLDRFSLAFRTRAASSWTFGGDEQVPISQRFYLGGRNSVRGFRENQLGPRGKDGNIIGGDLLFLASTELQYLLYDLFSLHTFIDAGNVFLKDQSTGISDLRRSAGVGFRYRSPIGPIGFDIGHPLDEKSGEPSVRLHFSVGSNF